MLYSLLVVTMTKLKDLGLMPREGITFDSERWKAKEIEIPLESGHALLADFLRHYDVTGMTEKQVEGLLGEPLKGRLADFLNDEPMCIVYEFQTTYLQIQFEHGVANRFRVLKPEHDRSTGRMFKSATKWANSQIIE